MNNSCVSTAWCPFRLQIYFNGHNHLASALKKESVSFSQIDNMFVNFDSFEHAQTISDQLERCYMQLTLPFTHKLALPSIIFEYKSFTH